jgi:hypothetical protein
MKTPWLDPSQGRGNRIAEKETRPGEPAGRLTKGPCEFREARVDLAKAKRK